MIPIKKAVILAGGEGTRLRPLTLNVPKALVDINRKTLTEHVINIMKGFGIDHFILGLGYMAEKVKEHFGNGRNFGVKIEYTVEDTPQGTAGPLLLMPKLKETFVMVNGDNLFDLDLQKMHEVHRKNKAVATIALTQVEDPSTSGVVKLKGDKIVEFVEKPKKEDAPSNWISSGYYIIEPEIYDYIPKGKEKVMLETDVWPKLAKAGKLFGYKDDGQWFDTGTIERLENVRKIWKG